VTIFGVPVSPTKTSFDVSKFQPKNLLLNVSVFGKDNIIVYVDNEIMKQSQFHWRKKRK
jgi:hypothetical protein